MRTHAASPDPPAGFAVADGGMRWSASGPLTFANAVDVLAHASALPLPTRAAVDLSGLGHVDSAAVAVLLALKRRAVREERMLRFENVPTSLHALAVVYGVAPMLLDQ